MINIKNAYTNAIFDDNNSFISGTLISNICIRSHGTPDWTYSNNIPADFNGILRFEIPLDAQVNNNPGFLVDFEDDSEHLHMDLILLNNRYSKPKVLLPYGVSVKDKTNKCSPMIYPQVNISSPRFACLNSRLSSNANPEDSSLYLLIHNISSQDNNKQECRMYSNKAIYSEGEAISISYEYLLGNFDTNIAGIEILMYTPQDVPGIHRSVDWLALKHLDKNLGVSNTVSFPIDGERNKEVYPEGDYILRLMYWYKDLCPSVNIKVLKESMNTNLKINPPSPGSFCIYSLNKNIDYVSLADGNDCKYLAVTFECNNSLMDLLEDTSYQASIDWNIANVIYNTFMEQKGESDTFRSDFMNNYTYLLSSYIYSLLYNALNIEINKSFNSLSYAYNNDPSQDLVTQIKNYIVHNIFEPISIETLANHFYFSKSHISHLFKDITGTSINKYISQARMIKAKELLGKSDMSITEVAQVLNFSDIHSFSHKFKKEMGLSPSQFKKDYKKIYEYNKFS